ncbi:MAG TPA: hypothetical protein VK463_12715 [Desulfomonilaceae bacterium]|nr:hypothetical protein [Desulfomonilaceae bacterium]
MKRVAAIVFGCLMLALLPGLAPGQGLFSLPGLPSFGNPLGGYSGCGEKVCPAGGLVGYVGWMENREGTSINADTRGLALLAARNVHHNTPNRGLWLGLTGTACLSDRIGFLASGWYLVPSNTSSRELYNDGALYRTWEVDPGWWYVDGLFALNGPAGLTLLAGLRYDYYTIKFKRPTDQGGFATLNSTADVTSNGYIPLFGTQFAYSSSMGNLVVRAVGVPTLIGNVTYRESFNNAVADFEAHGNYNNGYFLEFFGEYSKSFGPGSIGVFARWNGTEGKLQANAKTDPTGLNTRYDLTVHRLTWTVGGSFSLNFNMPFM